MTSEALRAKQIAFVALPIGVASLTVIFAVLAPLGALAQPLVETLFFAAAGLTLLGIVAAFLVQQRLAEALATAQTHEQALDLIFRRSLLAAAAVEAPALLALIGFLLSGDYGFLAFTVPFYIVVALLYPTAGRLEQRLRHLGRA